MPRTEIERQLSSYLTETDFGFIPHGRFSLSEVYQFVQDNLPHLCNDEFLCIDCCSNGENSAEWKHVVRGALSHQKNKNTSRVSHVEDQRGFWHFGEIIDL